MPQKATAGMTPYIEVDVDKKYIVEVIGITEAPAQFDNAKEGDMSLTWKFRLFDLDTGVAVIDINNGGFAYELWNFTGDKTYRNQKTGKVAKAREWTEALVGRDLTDAEMDELIDLGFEDSLMGRKGIVDLEWYLTRAGNERLRIIRLRPYKKGAPAAADPTTAPGAKTTAAVPAPDPVPSTPPQRSPEEIARRRAALGLDSDTAA